MNIGELIKNKIDEKGGKQVCLANKMSCSKSKISRICKNEYINTKKLIPVCIHLNYNFFNDYAEYVDKKIPKDNDLSFSYIYKFFMGEEMHIGQLIRKIKKERGIKTSILAEKMNCSEKNMQSIYTRTNMYTDMLFNFCKTLNFNFFEIYAEYIAEQLDEKNNEKKG